MYVQTKLLLLKLNQNNLKKSKKKNRIDAIQEELNQLEINEVWELVERPEDYSIIGTMWVFKCELGENVIIVINKARLVA